MKQEEDISKDLAEIDLMVSVSQGKLKVNCRNCRYSGHEKDEYFITCGVHHVNFTSTSFCTEFEQKNQ